MKRSVKRFFSERGIKTKSSMQHHLIDNVLWLGSLKEHTHQQCKTPTQPQTPRDPPHQELLPNSIMSIFCVMIFNCIWIHSLSLSLKDHTFSCFHSLRISLVWLMQLYLSLSSFCIASF